MSQKDPRATRSTGSRAPWSSNLARAPQLARLLEDYPDVRHIKVEDGPGRPLGRSFRVKLWPNLVFLNDGQVARQLARPDISEVRGALALIAGPSPRSESP
jgi:thioredoxin 1